MLALLSRKIKSYLPIILLAFLLILISGPAPFAVAAEGDAGGGVLSGGLQKAAGKAGFQSTSVENIASKIIYVVLGFVGIIFLGLIIWGGFTWMIARGNTEEIEKAKKIIERAVIGLVIVFAAYAITYFLTSRLTTTTTTGGIMRCPEGQIPCSCSPSDCPPGEMCFEEICLPEGDTCPSTCP